MLFRCSFNYFGLIVLSFLALPLAEITLQENKTKFVEGKTVSVICTGVGVPSPKIALFKVFYNSVSLILNLR